MRKNLFITLLLPLALLASCTTEGGKRSSSSVDYTSSSSTPVVSSSSSSKVEVSSSSSVKVELPADAQAFVDKVNSIVLNIDAGKDINDAFVLYDEVVNWDYDEVIEAFEKLVLLEELYNDYTKLYNGVESFIERVDSIPYNLTINDERNIVLAEEAYSKLSDEQKAMLGVSQAYERLLDARNDFDALYAQAIEEEKNKSAKGFTDLVDALPSVELVTLSNGDAILYAQNYYEGLADNIKEMAVVISALETLDALIARYNELVENPSINDGIVSMVFIDAVNKLPLLNDITLADGSALFAANDIYKTLPTSAKLSNSVIISYSELQDLITKYYDLYLTSVGKTRPTRSDEGVTLISSLDDFLNIKNNLSGSYRLACDIDLENMEWQNLGVFRGTLDGAGQTIYNINRTTSSEDATFALFLEVQTTATVKNLALEGSPSGVGTWEGSIAIRNYGTIENCLINLNIKSSRSDGHIGGVVCENQAGGKIKNFIVLSKIDGGNYDGGICVAQYGTVTESYFIGANVPTGHTVGNNGSALTNLSKTEAEIKSSSLYMPSVSSIPTVFSYKSEPLLYSSPKFSSSIISSSRSSSSGISSSS